jgi:hypothetical protein
MASIDREPKRLDPQAPPRRCPLPTTGTIRLVKPSSIALPFDAALRRRRSSEQFPTATFVDLSTWLYYVGAVQSVRAGDSNRQRRFVGSFGALHPAHILLGMPDHTWFAYLPREHSVGQLPVVQEAARELRIKAMQFHCAESATIVALLCDLDLVATYYKNASDLILRDAGVLFGHAALVASSVGLAFRILGTTGSEELEQLVCTLPFKASSAGLALVGGFQSDLHGASATSREASA